MRIRVLVTVFLLTISSGALLAQDREDAKRQVEFGIAVAQRGLWREAIYRWERAAKIDPTYAAALNNLAIAYEHEGELDDRRNQSQHRKARQFLDGVAAPFENAGQSTRLALEMKAQRQSMHVLECLERELPHGMHRNLREQAVADLREERHRDPGDPVEHGQEQRSAPEP